MGKYFGTDGVRGVANKTLTVEMALKIGKYIGSKFKDYGVGKILIGKDTRVSSNMFENALASGISAGGSDAYLLGVCSTPCVAYITKHEKFAVGVMISASHNPFTDNGIKLFNYEGQKMEEATLLEIEKYIDDLITVELAKEDQIGKIINYSQGNVLYESWLKQIVNSDFSNFKIALDLANGSATTSAVNVFTALKAKVKVIHSYPNGVNINFKCGSTHPESLQRLMREEKYDIGFAFDGDADRLICVNHLGEIVDGDQFMYVIGKYLKSHNKLEKNTVVTTVMSNLGLYKAFEQCGINTAKTKVGDKYVYESMVENGYVFGGEQSGHIIFKNFADTGDGLLSALYLLKVMQEEGKSLAALCEGMQIFPQLLVNVKVKDKKKIMSDKNILSLVDDISKQLGDSGRILVRESGTEELVRVMVEAETDALCQKYVYQVVELIEKTTI